MIAVWTATGRPMQVGEAVLDPSVPTLFEELPDDVAFQAVNLRMEEVSGPKAPSLGGAAWRDAKGETHGTPPEPTDEDGASSIEPYEAVVAERDALRTQLTRVHGDLSHAQASVSTVSTERDLLQGELHEALAAKDAARKAETEIRAERDQARQDLANAAQEKEGSDEVLATVSQERDEARSGIEAVEGVVGGDRGEDLVERLAKALERPDARTQAWQYAEANGLAIVDAKELDELRAKATDGKASGEATKRGR